MVGSVVVAASMPACRSDALSVGGECLRLMRWRRAKRDARRGLWLKGSLTIGRVHVVGRVRAGLLLALTRCLKMRNLTTH